MYVRTYIYVYEKRVTYISLGTKGILYIKLKVYFFFSRCPQRLAFLNTGHLALLPQLYFVQLVKFQICLLLILNMLNHGVMDYTK